MARRNPIIIQGPNGQNGCNGRNGIDGCTGATGPEGMVKIISGRFSGQEVGNYLMEWEGPWSENKLVNLSYSRNGNLITICMDSVKGLSTQMGRFIQCSNLPLHIRPEVTMEQIIPLIESIRIQGLVKITPEGQIIYSKFLDDTFMSGVTVGWNNHCIQYLI